MIYVGGLISAAVGVALVDILLSSWDAINILIESGVSMDLECIWEQYITIAFQQVRVRCYYHADGGSYGPFIWHFSNV